MWFRHKFIRETNKSYIFQAIYIRNGFIVLWLFSKVLNVLAEKVSLIPPTGTF
jgi:hypothetical protein